MADKLTPERRSAIMSRIRSKNTKPEMVVRRTLHGMGYRYRLHAKELPGKPDIVFRRRRSVIFVHGCFWHSHPGCRHCKTPMTNTGYWQPKLLRNIERDAEHVAALEAEGWRVLIVWECEAKPGSELEERLSAFLTPSP